MNPLFLLVLALISLNARAVDVVVKLKLTYTNPKVTAMACAGNTCSCPDATLLDQSMMKCVQCPESFSYEPKKKQCFDPNQATEVRVADVRVTSPETIKAIADAESTSPKLCNVATQVDGKFAECQCDEPKIGVNSTPRSTITFPVAFSQASQKCERNGAILVKVPSLSCYGPMADNFSSLKTLEALSITSKKPTGASLAVCGVSTGEFIFTLKNDALRMSLLDSIFLSANPKAISVPNMEGFAIDSNSINY